MLKATAIQTFATVALTASYVEARTPEAMELAQAAKIMYILNLAVLVDVSIFSVLYIWC